MLKIDWGNPITQNLVFDAPFSEGAGQVTEDVASPLGMPVIGSFVSTVKWDKHLFGTDLDFSSATSNVNFTTPNNANGGTYISIESLVYCRSLIGGGSTNRVASKGNPVRWQFGAEDGGTNAKAFEFDVNSSGTQAAFQTPANSLTFNTWIHYVVTCDLSVAMGSLAPKMYLNGISQTVTTSVTGTGTIQADSNTVIIANNAAAAGVRAWDGKIAYFRYWNRLLTATEVWSLYTNPWQIYVSPNYNYLNFVSPAVTTNTSNFMPFFRP